MDTTDMRCLATRGARADRLARAWIPIRAGAVLVALVALVLAVSACRKAEQVTMPDSFDKLAAQAAAPGGPNVPAALPIVHRAMRISVDTAVVVGNLDAAVGSLRAEVARLGGYVSEGTVTGGGGYRSARFEARVPTDRLAEFRAHVARLGEVVSDSEKAEDVTEQRADIDARLRNARAQEKRLLALLSDKAGSLADVVAVEKELAAVRETIERIDAQQRLLEGQIAFATVKVQLSPRHVESSLGPGTRIARAASDGVETAGAFLVGLAVVTAAAGPTLLIIAAIGVSLFWTVRAIVRRRRRRAGAAGRATG
jgi:hypothetical protein